MEVFVTTLVRIKHQQVHLMLTTVRSLVWASDGHRNLVSATAREPLKRFELKLTQTLPRVGLQTEGLKVTGSKVTDSKVRVKENNRRHTVDLYLVAKSFSECWWLVCCADNKRGRSTSSSRVTRDDHCRTVNTAFSCQLWTFRHLVRCRWYAFTLCVRCKS